MAMAHGQAGRYGEALDAFDRHIERHPADTDVLFQALRLAYRARAGDVVVAGKTEDQQRFDRYLRAYVAAKGPNRALVEQWAKAFGATDRWGRPTGCGLQGYRLRACLASRGVERVGASGVMRLTRRRSRLKATQACSPSLKPSVSCS